MKPVLRHIAQGKHTGSHRLKTIISIICNFAISFTSVYFYFPRKFLLHTFSWFYFVFGLDYGYKLFEKIQLDKLNKRLKSSSTDKLSMKEPDLRLFIDLLQKSWLIFPFCFSFLWKFYITEPERVHGLPMKLFSLMNQQFNLATGSSDFISELRSLFYNNHRFDPQFSGILLKALPSCFITLMKMIIPVIFAKNILKYLKGGHKFELEIKSILDLFMATIRESLKLTLFLAGVPFSSFVLTTILAPLMAADKRSLQIIGFISGSLAIIYKGKKRTDFDPDSLVCFTNREAWLNILREVTIAATSPCLLQSSNMELLDRLSFAAGLTTILSIYDYQAILNNPARSVLKDAKFLSFLSRLVDESNMFLFE
ncbi:uncharacterized protein PRCAT00005088001 [Priceomyces carsonii]|uniref:uncharacterized protein n=1 Tax=Priceomyces carsonii TaxID=28549 RepID=UPI002EDABD3F|nr:unnamed protein product [Priceomyces carsonii]